MKLCGIYGVRGRLADQQVGGENNVQKVMEAVSSLVGT